MTPKAKIIVICGPTAVGKTVVIQRVLEQLPSLHTGITYTTRAPRPTNKEDKVLHYINRDEFEQKKQRGEFIEWAEYTGDLHGTSKDSIITDGSLILNLDVQGSLQIKKLYPDSLLLFISPESLDQIKERLERRNLAPEDFQKRLQAAEECLAGKDTFDHIIINRENRLEQTVSEVVRLIQTYLILDKKEENS